MNLPGLALRPWRSGDLPVLAAWYEQTDSHRHALGGQTLAQALPALSHGMPGLRMLVEGDGRAVGVISAEERAVPGGTILWIRLLLVDPHERGKGYGRCAVSRLFGLCGAGSRVRRVLVAVDEQNGGGLRFWMRLGFQPVRRLDRGERYGGCAVRILAWEGRMA